MGRRFYTLDVFTDRIFGGNPLAVCTEAQGLSPAQMQQIAAEINYSETVFVLPATTPEANFRLRIFTPTTELDFAGHPTVGAAYLLGLLQGPPARPSTLTWQLEEPVGLVPVSLDYGPDGLSTTTLTVAQLPQTNPCSLAITELATLLSLEVHQLQTGKNGPQAYSCGLPFLFLPLVNRDALAKIKFNQARGLYLLKEQGTPGLYCFAPADPAIPLGQNSLIYGRMFAPGLGIAEDPATGSGVAALGGYLGDRLEKPGSYRWQIDQGIEMGRPSQLQLGLQKGPQGIERVTVGGKSVLVSEGILHI